MNTVAIIYDFDKTLSPKDMQEYGFIEDLKIVDPLQFWSKVDDMAKKHRMDRVLAYMYLMIHQARQQGIIISKKHFISYGEKIVLYPGLEEWFETINQFGISHNLLIKHIIISSGLRPMIMATPIAPYFQEIFACEFVYNDKEEAIWPALAINYTTKTQFIYRINKGILDITDDVSLNKPLADELRPVPFDHMIFIGDGLTDVPSMKLVTSLGGQAIAVYDPANPISIQTAKDLLHDKRVQYTAAANYHFGQPLSQLVTTMIKKVAIKDELARWGGEESW